ncbi:MAG: DUF5671 domain-containing protein [Acidobacteria bacterium]|nr:DUF5671 domain-containing protein [Acidobacteriota bacterium]
MGKQGLQEFIEAARLQGASDTILVELLRHEGWTDSDIFGALREFYERQTGLALPARRASRGRAKDAFLYLLNFVTLGTWTIALGSVWFALIEALFPDSAGRYVPDFRYSISSAVASIVIGFPIFLMAARFISHELRDDAEKLESPVRKWLTYLALLVAATIVIADLITFVSYFLRGELTVRFAAKVSVVLAIAGGVFAYYLASMLPKFGEIQQRLTRRFLIVSSIVVLGSIAAGFANLGSPGHQRSLQADETRIRDLLAIQRNLAGIWAGAKNDSAKLPGDLNVLAAHGLIVRDPDTGRQYEYVPAGGSTYQLCAIFDAPAAPAPRQYSALDNPFATHGSGRQCFALDAAVRPVDRGR